MLREHVVVVDPSCRGAHSFRFIGLRPQACQTNSLIGTSRSRGNSWAGTYARSRVPTVGSSRSVSSRALDQRLSPNDYTSEPPRQRTRLADALLATPSRLDYYFDGGPSPYRRIIWLCITFGFGYYSANVVSLSFGALGTNDVVAAIVTVGFCEVVSRAYWSADRPGFQIVLAQAFKLDVTAALIVEALKLQT